MEMDHILFAKETTISIIISALIFSENIKLLGIKIHTKSMKLH